MNKIQILATRPSGHPFPIISWLIRLGEWSAQSHVAIYFPEQAIVRHAHFNEFKEVNVDEFLKTNKLVNFKALELTPDEYSKIDSYTESKLGKQSGYFSTLFGNLLPQMCRALFSIKLKNPFYEGMTCSEFVRESLRKVNEVAVFVLTNDIPKGTFTTDDALALTAKLAETK